MGCVNWESVENLFHAARELDAGERRGLLLGEPTQIRDAVEGLLRHADGGERIARAITGAAGLFGSQRTSDCPPTGRCPGSLPGQLSQLRELLDSANRRKPERGLDLLLLTIGANDIKFSGLVADVIVSSGVERTLFRQGGMMATVAESQRLLQRELPANFAKLRTALKQVTRVKQHLRPLRAEQAREHPY